MRSGPLLCHSHKSQMSLDSLEQRLAAAEASLMAMPDADAVFAALVTTPSVPFDGQRWKLSTGKQSPRHFPAHGQRTVRPLVRGGCVRNRLGYKVLVPHMWGRGIWRRVLVAKPV